MTEVVVQETTLEEVVAVLEKSIILESSVQKETVVEEITENVVVSGEQTTAIVESIESNTVVSSGFIQIIGSEENSFEKFNKNLKSYNYSITYTNGVLSSLNYTTPGGTIVKTLNYVNGILVSIVLSGSIPSGISTTKTFNYTNGIITSINYS